MKPTKKSYDDSCSRPNEIMKTPALRKSKYYINTGSFRHHNNCGSTHPLMAASEENKLPPSFSGFKSKKISPWIQLWCGLRNRQWWTVVKKNLSKCLSSLAVRSVLLISKRLYILLVNASCKRLALIIEDEFKILTLLIIVNRVIFNRLVIVTKQNQSLHISKF